MISEVMERAKKRNPQKSPENKMEARNVRFKFPVVNSLIYLCLNLSSCIKAWLMCLSHCLKYWHCRLWVQEREKKEMKIHLDWLVVHQCWSTLHTKMQLQSSCIQQWMDINKEMCLIKWVPWFAAFHKD